MSKTENQEPPIITQIHQEYIEEIVRNGAQDILVYDNEGESGELSRNLISLMKIAMRRNE